MARRVIGLDIGSFAVRAAEISVSDGIPTVIRFGQITLPPGAVHGGEIADPEAVVAALRRLWEEVGFDSRSVVLGIANQRVVVRQAELPAMPDADLEAALRFEAADLIPIPIDDAHIDFQPVESSAGVAGEGRMRILLAAAHVVMIERLLAVVNEAGLAVVRIDPQPLSLVRSLAAQSDDVIGEVPVPEAIVDVGTNVTTLVVHEAGVPRFSRFIDRGAAGATDEIAGRLGIGHDEAEDFKRQLAAGVAGLDPRGIEAIERSAQAIATEVANSLDYYVGQFEGQPVARILLTGAGSRLAGLAEWIRSTVGVPVERAVLPAQVVVDAGLTEEQQALVGPSLPNVIGIALAGMPGQRGVRRISLLPATVHKSRNEKRQVIVTGVGLSVLAALLTGVWGARGSQVARAEHQDALVQAQVAALNSQASKLQWVSALDQQVTALQGQVKTALTGDVAWADLLRQISGSIPSDVWLGSFTGNKSASTSATAGGSGPSLGTLTFSGFGFSHDSSAHWLTQVGALKSIGSLWVSSSNKPDNGPTTFSSSGALTTGALADRLPQYTGADR
ncbi:MAG TPA: type IV pilus assembly protein PilM [Acidimicrobiales bacterium]|nr:type IV pilus assembly protein PilM [Acidimicrobiales bacterium]